MARAGVTTRPLPLASSPPSSPSPPSPPPSSSAPAAKRRKVNHRDATGGAATKEEEELTRFRNSADSISGLERCSPSPSSPAAAEDTAEKEDEEEEEIDHRLRSDASCCSSNGSFEFSDLQAGMETESARNCSGGGGGGGGERRETASNLSTVIGGEISDGGKSMERSELRNSGESSSAAAVRDSAVVTNRQRILVTEAEVESFFSMMNGGNQELNRLNQKYNFDFANEKPLEGRYEWIPLKP